MKRFINVSRAVRLALPNKSKWYKRVVVLKLLNEYYLNRY